MEGESQHSGGQKAIHFDIDAGLEHALLKPQNDHDTPSPLPNETKTFFSPVKSALPKEGGLKQKSKLKEPKNYMVAEESSVTPNPYEKENNPLRPYLKKFKNIEDNVATLRLNDLNYLMVTEEKPSVLSNVRIH
jgi:hypothetical protein